MHELGVLLQAVKTAANAAQTNNIPHIKHLTLEVGSESGFVPVFFEKLWPVATENFPVMSGAQLKIEMSPGTNLIIKEIGY